MSDIRKKAELYPGRAAEDGERATERRAARHSRQAGETAIQRSEARGGSVADKLLADVIAPNRDSLRNELIALYHQYTADANCALSMQTEYQQMIEQARDAHTAVSQRLEVLRSLLDAEFPGWESR